MEERKLWLWLAESLHYNPKQTEAVCREFPSVQSIYELNANQLKNLSFLSLSEQGLLSDKDLSFLSEKISYWTQAGIWFLTPSDSDYPALLRELPHRPAVLFGRGNLPDFSQFPLAVAITGTRKSSPYGTRIAPRFARELAEAGALQISGLAEGIETLAADAAERAGGTLIVVLPGGVDQVYPRSNRRLLERILSRGAVLSEFPPGIPPLRHLMPYRNRLLSGLSDAVLVLESGLRSGTRITTDYALEQGRDVLAVPGSIDNEKAVGTNRLIQDGATMILGTEDILTRYQTRFTHPIRFTKPASSKMELVGVHQVIYDLLDPDEPMGMDRLAEQTGLPVSVLNLSITQLELSGHVLRMPGNRLVRK